MPLRNLNDFNAGEMRDGDSLHDRHDLQSAVCRAIMLSSMTAENALNTLDKLAPCIWPRLVHAQAEIEALRSELRAAREGEERAYEALKRLRTHENTRTRSSSRARLLLENGESRANSAAGAATDAVSPSQGLHTILDKNTPIKDAHSMVKEMAEERLALPGEMQKSKQNLFPRNDLDTSSVQESLIRMQEEHDVLRQQISDRDRQISELLTKLEDERLKSARHREVAATV
jgi:chromosome segregation ATPase